MIVRSSESVPAGVDNIRVSLSRTLSSLVIGFVGMLGTFGSAGKGVEVLLDILLDVRFGLDILPVDWTTSGLTRHRGREELRCGGCEKRKYLWYEICKQDQRPQQVKNNKLNIRNR